MITVKLELDVVLTWSGGEDDCQCRRGYSFDKQIEMPCLPTVKSYVDLDLGIFDTYAMTKVKELHYSEKKDLWEVVLQQVRFNWAIDDCRFFVERLLTHGWTALEPLPEMLTAQHNKGDCLAT